MLIYENKLCLVAFLVFCLGGNTNAGELACSDPANESEEAICKDPMLADLALLAAELGDAIGLDIRYSDIDPPSDIYPRFDRLVRTLRVADMDKLVAGRNLWTFDFDDANEILFMSLEASPLQDMMIVFETDGKVAYVASEDAEDAGRYHYRSVGNILEITSSFLPARFTNKFRHQDGCWRLIGEDGSWRDEDPYASSINYLTGRAIFQYKDGSSTTRTFDPFVSCLGDNFYAYEITYHDD